MIVARIVGLVRDGGVSGGVADLGNVGVFDPFGCEAVLSWEWSMHIFYRFRRDDYGVWCK